MTCLLDFPCLFTFAYFMLTYLPLNSNDGIDIINYTQRNVLRSLVRWSVEKADTCMRNGKRASLWKSGKLNQSLLKLPSYATGSLHSHQQTTEENALRFTSFLSLLLKSKQAVPEAATICTRLCDLDLWPFDLESGVRVTCNVGYLCANFSLPYRPLCSRVRPDVRDGQTDRRQTSDKSIA